MGFSERAWTVYRLKRGLGKKVGVVVLRGVGGGGGVIPLIAHYG